MSPERVPTTMDEDFAKIITVIDRDTLATHPELNNLPVFSSKFSNWLAHQAPLPSKCTCGVHQRVLVGSVSKMRGRAIGRAYYVSRLYI